MTTTAAPSTEKTMTVAEKAKATGKFKTFLQIAAKAKMMEVLDGKGPLTVFAPLDEAFAHVPENQLARLTSSEEQATRLIAYHIIPGNLPITAVMELQSADTLEGSKVTIVGCNGVQVNHAKVILADNECSNGIIHVIDRVLRPPEVTE